MKTISYTRGNPAGRALRIEWLMKRTWGRARALREAMDGKNLDQKIELHRQVKNLEKHLPRLKALWVCYTRLAEDAANERTV